MCLRVLGCYVTSLNVVDVQLDATQASWKEGQGIPNEPQFCSYLSIC